MYFSRSLEELHPRVAKKARFLISKCAEDDIDLLVVCTYRDMEAEQALHAQGRKKAGPVLTRGWPKGSYHPWRMAFDVVPMRYGLPVWSSLHPTDRKLWRHVGEIGEALGLEWGGRWNRFLREYPHFQLTEGLSIAQLEAGKTL